MDAAHAEVAQVRRKFTDHERERVFNATTYGAFFAPMNATGCNGGPCSVVVLRRRRRRRAISSTTSPSNGTLTRYWLAEPRTWSSDVFFDAFTGRIPYPPQNFSVGERS